MTEDEMAGWHHRLYGHEFEQAPGVGDGAPVAATNKPLSPKRYRTNRIRSLVLISINLVLAILLLWLNIVIRAANMYYSGIFFAALSLIIGKAKISLKGGNNSEG